LYTTAAQHRDDALDLRRDAGDRLLALAQERGAQQQVFRRVAADRQFGEQHHVGAVLVAGDLRQFDDARAVAGHVADREVVLRQGDAEGSGHDVGCLVVAGVHDGRGGGTMPALSQMCR